MSSDQNQEKSWAICYCQRAIIFKSFKDKPLVKKFVF